MSKPNKNEDEAFGLLVETVNKARNGQPYKETLKQLGKALETAPGVRKAIALAKVGK